jgi:predicted Zn-dependent protease
MGLVLRRLGKADEAKVYEQKVEVINEANRKMEKALLLLLKDPHNPALRYDIGAAHLVQGKEAQAVKMFLSALHEDPTHAPSHKALAEYYARQPDARSQGLAAFHHRHAELGKRPPTPPR